MSAFRIQAVMALAEDFCLSLIMKATISTMALRHEAGTHVQRLPRAGR